MKRGVFLYSELSIRTRITPGLFKVDFEYMHKHKPQVGGYYVVYKDGYKSFSPAEAFETGYEKI